MEYTGMLTKYTFTNQSRSINFILSRLIIAVGLIYCFSQLLGCAASPASAEPVNKKQSVEQRQQDLRTVNNWYIKGSLGVSDAEEAWSASLFWRQAGSKFNIQLYGPAGFGTLKIDGTANRVVLTTAQNEVITSNNADQLFEQQTGWYLPVTNMRYWIRAMPAPGSTAEKRYDQYKHLVSLKQQGWQINYLRFTSVKGLDLPSKIFMNNDQLKVKLVISQWDI